MNANRQKPYYLGIDLGTNSIGMAITDENYNLLKVKGKDFWFVREFDESKTQEDRRTNRTSRRRLNRNQARIGLVSSYFSDEIEKEDALFFVRLANSKYYPDDKDEKLNTKDSLFADEMYHDSDYYKEFPTIFHLRSALIHDKVIYSERYARLVYLAICNIFKHRGHFLSNATSDDLSAEIISDHYDTFISFLEQHGKIIDATVEEVLEILADKQNSRSIKKEKLFELLDISKSEKTLAESIKCICGLDSDARIMFSIEAESKISVRFNSTSFDDEKNVLLEEVGDSNFEIIEAMKQIYDYSQLKAVLNGFEYLSDARCEMYKKHALDLKVLKRVYKELGEIKYDTMFRSSDEGTYSAYVNSLNSKKALAQSDKYRRNMKKRSSLDLYSLIKKDLSKVQTTTPDIDYILKEIDLEQFLPKQITGANGVIPNQIHSKELKAILKNAEKKLPFLLDIDDSGLTVSERIIRLFEFNIPYYIGPIGEGAKTGWAVRKDEGRILPWNIEEKIDIDATAEKFILNLIKKCTFLGNEYVVPKQSLIYEKYCVLNEINNIRINGERIDVAVKKDIFSELFLSGKKVTKKSLCAYLKNRGLISFDEEISGIDKQLNNQLSSYHKMYSIFGEKIEKDYFTNVAEEIIYFATVFGDSKKMFKNQLSKMVAENKISEEEMQSILNRGYKFKDWGRLSRKMLTLVGCEKSTGEKMSLMDAMWETQYNFMELIYSDEFTYKDELARKVVSLEKSLSSFEFDDLNEFYYSAPVKRMIWQTLLCIREVIDIMGHSPKRIFIEMTRSDDEKGERGRSVSRENQLLELYSSKEDKKCQSEIKASALSGKLNSKKLYLYYLQMGKDAYTGEPIEIEDLFDETKYDIDHIRPRSLTDDNSIANNLVLTSKYMNEHVKKDIYPIPNSIRGNAKVIELWNSLHYRGFMNDEKYNRLIRSSQLSENELAGFIARQLVETSQGAKGIADIIKALIPDTEIVYSKAANVSRFRQENGFVKSRLVNEYHHAKDAYLNVVVGNVYFTKFTNNPIRFVQNEYAVDKKKNHYNLAKMFAWDVVRGNCTAWVAPRDGNEGTIRTVRQVMAKNTPIITRLPYVNKGTMFNIQPVGKYSAKADNYVPLKASDNKLSDVTKYGGYTSLDPAYFVFIEYGKPGKRERRFEVVTKYAAPSIKDERDLVEYFSKDYENVNIISKRIKKQSLIKYNGYFLYIIGMDSRKNVEFSNATALAVSDKYIKYIRLIEKSYEKIQISTKAKKEVILPEEIDEVSNKNLYLLFKEKHVNEIYKNHPKSLGTILEEGERTFSLLSLEKQVEVLYRLICFSSFAKSTFSLADIGGPKEVGRIRISGNMTGASELKLINQSVTGMYDNQIDLLK